MPQATASSATYAPQVTTGAASPPHPFATEYDAVVATIGHYVQGGREGKSSLMRPSFLADATMVGYAGGQLFTGTIEQLYDWIDANGPAPDLETRLDRKSVV